jgi:hypothetical protein
MRIAYKTHDGGKACVDCGFHPSLHKLFLYALLENGYGVAVTIFSANLLPTNHL